MAIKINARHRIREISKITNPYFGRDFYLFLKKTKERKMEIQRFNDASLAHNSYAILVDNQVVVIDPMRNPEAYIEYANVHNAKITHIIETHPHADFLSGHLELSLKTGANIYVSKLLGAEYTHIGYDEGDKFVIGNVEFISMSTPGHSPDSISILITENGIQKAIFTGDTLFVGDVGRPDLRESVGNIQKAKEELAEMMYDSTRNKLMKLQEEVLVYPAHGAGSLCGKAISDVPYSTIGSELKNNYALQTMGKPEFVKILIEDQPMIPKYFAYCVELNKKGASSYQDSIDKITISSEAKLITNTVIIDARNQADFKRKHIVGAINLQDGEKFETWLGAIVSPNERITLLVESKEQADLLIRKAAKIGYELLIEECIVVTEELLGLNKVATSVEFNYDDFKQNKDNYYILDIRNHGEVKNGKFFPNATAIPLPELRDRFAEIKTDKSILVHCAAGYRSAAGSSILESLLPNNTIYDLSVKVEEWK